MNLFVVYDLTSGAPKRHGFCGSDDVALQAISTNNEGVVDVTNLADWDGNETNWIWNGSALVLKPANPVALLAAAKQAQTEILQAAYNISILAPVSFTTAAGTTSMFAQDVTSKANMQDAIDAGIKSETWDLNLWLDANGAVITPFTLSDLQSLAAALEAYDTPKFSELLSLLAQVNAATTIEAVQAVTWS